MNDRGNTYVSSTLSLQSRGWGPANRGRPSGTRACAERGRAHSFEQAKGEPDDVGGGVVRSQQERRVGRGLFRVARRMTALDRPSVDRSVRDRSAPDRWIGGDDAREELRTAYRRVRDLTEALAAPLRPEDQVIQSMADVSPTKWHRGHTTWFFETFLLEPNLTGYDAFDPDFRYLFNSYYEAVGPRHPRSQRGLLSRPTVDEVARYRRHVDAAMEKLIDRCDSERWAAFCDLAVLGLHHEQQHQELLHDGHQARALQPSLRLPLRRGRRDRCPLGAGSPAAHDGARGRPGRGRARRPARRARSRSTTSRRATSTTSSRSGSPTGS